MGELNMTGRAERECGYDRMIIKVTFNIYDTTADQAVEKMMEQCEKFLLSLRQMGVDMDAVRFSGDDIDKRYDHEEDEQYIHARRTVSIRLPFDMKLINRMMEDITSYEYDIDLSHQYDISDRAAVHEELLKEAVADSRKKAEFIAEAAGQEITGIISVNKEPDFDERYLEQECVMMDSCIGSAYDVSDMMNGPVTVETEEIDIVWEIG